MLYNVGEWTRSPQMPRPTVEYEYAHNGEKLLRLLQKQHPDYHPILAIAKLAHQAMDAGFEEYTAEGKQYMSKKPDLALRAHTTVLRYVEPELKSVEITLNRDKGRTIEVSLFDDEVHQKRVMEERRLSANVSNVLDLELMPEEQAT